MQYKLLESIEYMMTRDVILENLETGTVIKCFDDSDLGSFEDFSFMKVNESYDCKIELFGDPVTEETQWSIEVDVLSADASVGTRKMIEVSVDQDIYYISPKGVGTVAPGETLLFSTTRNDLIQVDNVLHRDFL